MKIPTWFLGSSAVLALIGFIDATYLTVEHYLGLVPPCTITQGCEQVTTSSYSLLFGIIPVALLGALFYVGALALLLWLWDRRDPLLFKLYARYTWLGLLAAIYFTSIQAFILKAYCQYCLLSALTSTILFLLAQYLVYRTPKQHVEISADSTTT